MNSSVPLATIRSRSRQKGQHLHGLCFLCFVNSRVTWPGLGAWKSDLDAGVEDNGAFNRWLCLGSNEMMASFFWVFGALCAGLSVVFSAAFAHLPQFAGGVPAMVQTALNQQQFHALGLLLVAFAVSSRGPSRWWLASGGLMVVGMVLFSFNLYARALLGFEGLRAFVPWGGSAWIAAWLLAAVAFARTAKPSTTT